MNKAKEIYDEYRVDMARGLRAGGRVRSMMSECISNSRNLHANIESLMSAMHFFVDENEEIEGHQERQKLMNAALNSSEKAIQLIDKALRELKKAGQNVSKADR